MLGDDAELLLTIDECLVLIGRLWDEIEHTVLDQAAADAIKAGFDEAGVRVVIEERARRLRETRQGRLETARQMLEARATSLQ